MANGRRIIAGTAIGCIVLRIAAATPVTVTVGDVTAIQRNLAETEMLNGDQLLTADVDGDGEVTVADATLLQMYLAEFDVTIG